MKNTTMKKNWALRIGSGALAVAVLTVCLVSGTFAKYTTTVKGDDSMEVARFGYNVADGDGTALATTPKWVKLFSNQATTYGNGTAVAKQTPGLQLQDRGVILAPGTYGYFQLVFDAKTTDVDVVMSDTVVELFNWTLGEADTGFIDASFGWTDDNVPVGDMVTHAAADGSYTEATRFTMDEFKTKLQDLLTGSGTLKKRSKAVLNVTYKWVDATANDAADTAIGQALVTATTRQGDFRISSTGTQYTSTTEPTYITAPEPVDIVWAPIAR